jgi:hypothetical protein
VRGRAIRTARRLIKAGIFANLFFIHIYFKR